MNHEAFLGRFSNFLSYWMRNELLQPILIDAAMRIVITGAAGPVGRAVVEELAADHQLCLIDKTPLAKQPSIVADLAQNTEKSYRGKRGDAAGAKPLKRPMSSFIRCIEAEFDDFHVVYGVSAQKTAPYDLSHTGQLLSWSPRQLADDQGCFR